MVRDARYELIRNDTGDHLYDLQGQLLEGEPLTE